MTGNDASHWREFEKNDLTHSNAHYLMAVAHLLEEQGYSRVTDVAKMLEVSRGAASVSLKQLKERGWVQEDSNRFLQLTDDGKRVSRLVEKNYVILSRFFTQVLGVPNDVAQADACKMEHLMSGETGFRLLGLMRWLMSDKKRCGDVNQAMERFINGCDDKEDLCPVCEPEGVCLIKGAPSKPSEVE